MRKTAVSLCLVLCLALAAGFPMEFQRPMEPEEAVMVEETVSADDSTDTRDQQQMPRELESETPDEADEGQNSLVEGSSNRESKQMLFAHTGPFAAVPHLAPQPIVSVRHLGLAGGDVQQRQQQLLEALNYRRLGYLAASEAQQQQLRQGFPLFNRNQIIDGIIGALELLRGGFRGSQPSGATTAASYSAGPNSSPKRIQLASDSVNQAVTIIGTPQADQVALVPSSNTDRLDTDAQSDPSPEKINYEIQTLLDNGANRYPGGSGVNQQGGLVQTNSLGGVPLHGVSDLYESQVILGSLAPERPAPAFQGLSNLSNNLPAFQLPTVSQSLQSITNLLRLPVRVINGWLVQ